MVAEKHTKLRRGEYCLAKDCSTGQKLLVALGSTRRTPFGTASFFTVVGEVAAVFNRELVVYG